MARQIASGVAGLPNGPQPSVGRIAKQDLSGDAGRRCTQNTLMVTGLPLCLLPISTNMCRQIIRVHTLVSATKIAMLWRIQLSRPGRSPWGWVGVNECGAIWHGPLPQPPPARGGGGWYAIVGKPMSCRCLAENSSRAATCNRASASGASTTSGPARFSVSSCCQSQAGGRPRYGSAPGSGHSPRLPIDNIAPRHPGAAHGARIEGRGPDGPDRGHQHRRRLHLRPDAGGPAPRPLAVALRGPPHGAPRRRQAPGRTPRGAPLRPRPPGHRRAQARRPLRVRRPCGTRPRHHGRGADAPGSAVRHGLHHRHPSAGAHPSEDAGGERPRRRAQCAGEAAASPTSPT